MLPLIWCRDIVLYILYMNVFRVSREITLNSYMNVLRVSRGITLNSFNSKIGKVNDNLRHSSFLYHQDFASHQKIKYLISVDMYC